MLCRALPVRSATAVVCRMQTLPQCTAKAFSTGTRRQLSSATQLPKRSITTVHKPTFAPQFRCQRRLNSTAPGINTAPAVEAPTASPKQDPDSQLTWNRFLALRKTRRRISLVASIISASGAIAVGIVVLSTQDVDSMGAQMLGLDPIIVLGLSTVACGLVGWLIGPFFGNAFFNVWHKRLRGQIALVCDIPFSLNICVSRELILSSLNEQKEREFYARIKKFRVDPTSSSMQNPVPDYYGEKIGSVTDYRRWLKDQRAFNLKRGKML
jgi:import inner membrane translocase subunit TIM23